MKSLPELGVGLGFREPLRSQVFLHQDEIDFLEITSDHYLDAVPRKREELDLLRQHFTLIPHSLDLSLGSAEGIDEHYLEKLANLVETIQPPWFSDHICFTRSNGIKIGHLAPLPHTREALRVVIANIERVKKRISAPMILENITRNINYPSSEMSEAEFVTTLLDETDCGMLLDVTNLYINSKNLDYDWRSFLDQIPLDRVVQLHFVGSHRNGSRLIDAHADPTEEDIWTVFREVCERCHVKGAILERDENFPVFRELLKEVATAGELMRTGAQRKRAAQTS